LAPSGTKPVVGASNERGDKHPPEQERVPPLKPKTRADLAISDFGDELVVCEPSGQIHYMNPSAATVFRLCDGTGTPAELAADIADAYGLPAGQIESDVAELVRTFRRQGLLTFKPVTRRRPAHNDRDPEHDHEHEHDHDHQHDHEREHSEEPSDARKRIRREVPRSD
jgi:hypothetical protein